MKKDLSKLYNRLTGEERFKLTLAAIARDDDGELGHLDRTCPRKTYEVSDPACKDRFIGSQYIALIFALDWVERERAYSIIRVGTELMVLAVRNLLQGYSRGIAAAENPDKSYPPFMAPGDEKLLGVAKKELPEGYINTLQGAKKELKGVLAAFETFCRDVDVDMDHMLVWVPHIKNQIEGYRSILADVQPDESTTLLHLNLYRDFWTKKTGHKFEDTSIVA